MFELRLIHFFFPKRKNDQFLTGHSNSVFATNTLFCPCKLLKHYFIRLSESISSKSYSGPFLPSIKKVNKIWCVNSNKPASYAAIRNTQITVLKAIDIDSKLFGLHSSRAGSATLAKDSHSNTEVGYMGGWARNSSMPELYDRNAKVRAKKSVANFMKSKLST